MIQRVQSFYLVLVLVGVILMLRFPIATYKAPTADGGEISAALQLLPNESVQSDDLQDLRVLGDDIVSFGGKWVITVVVAFIAVIALASIFLYKNRVLQMRVVAVGFLLNVVLVFLIFFWAINGASGSGGYLKALVETGIMGSNIAVSMLTPGTIPPIVPLVLLFLAQRAIRKDEMKVRAADRLR